MDGVTSLIREKWQPACLAGNLKSIRYKRALTSALVKFSLKTSYIHFFLLVLDSVKPQIKSWFRSPLMYLPYQNLGNFFCSISLCRL